jgi:tetratricopeptide (TPR) repeat protein
MNNIPEAEKPLFERYLKGRELQQVGRNQEALKTFESCFEVVDSLAIERYVDIMLCIGFCHANMAEYPKALDVYAHIEAVIQQSGEWHNVLPGNLKIGVPESYSGSDEAKGHLAKLYDSIGIAHQNRGETNTAMEYFTQAIDLYKAVNYPYGIGETLYFIANGQEHRQDWKGLQSTGEQLLELYTNLDDANGKLIAWRTLILSHNNQQNMEEVEKYLERTVDTMRKMRHPELRLNEKVLKEVRKQLKKSDPDDDGKKWQFWKR